MLFLVDKLRGFLSDIGQDERGDGMGQLLVSVGGVVLAVTILTVMIPNTRTVILNTIQTMLTNVTTLFQ